MTENPSKPGVVVLAQLAEAAAPARAAWFELSDAHHAQAAVRSGKMALYGVDEPQIAVVKATLNPGKVSRKGEITLHPVETAALTVLVRQLRPIRENGTTPTSVPQNASQDISATLPNKIDPNRLWATLAVGDIVLAPELDEEGTPDGWWEAVVLAITGDSFKLRWRDYPEQGQITRPRHQIAFLHPRQQKP